MILCAAFHRAFPSQLSLCTGAQLLSEVWSAPHAPGPRRPPGQQQPLRSPCPARAVHAEGGPQSRCSSGWQRGLARRGGNPRGTRLQDPLGTGPPGGRPVPLRCRVGGNAGESCAAPARPSRLL